MSEHEGQIVEAAADETITSSEETISELVAPGSAAENIDDSPAPTEEMTSQAQASSEVIAEEVTIDDSQSAQVEAQSEATEPVSAEAQVPASEAEASENNEPATLDASVNEPAAIEVKDESASAAVASSAGAQDDDDAKKVVRVLSVGQEIVGTVKRLTDFGAFVDIGVGRDGLLHISELSLQRVNKVTDVLSQGQEVTIWIKELNREKNRISLTMVSPDTKTIRDLNKDDVIEGVVTRMMPYGAFIDIGIGRDALLHVREMGEGFIKRPEDVLSIGEKLEVKIIEVSRRRGRVDLSIKGLRPEPESDSPTAQAQEEEVTLVDEFEDVEPMSAIEMALKRAMEANNGEGRNSKRDRRKDKKSRRYDDEFDDIVARTLSSD